MKSFATEAGIFYTGIVSPSGTILVVEDDHLVLEVTKSMVEYGGYTVITASDGEEALNVLSEWGDRVSLVLTDIKMPRMDGITLAERILNQKKNLPILFMSGYRSGTETLHKMSALAAKTGGLIRKPFRLRELLDRIAETLRAPHLSND